MLNSPPDFNISFARLQLRFVVKRLLLGLVLIVSASVALLLSDLGRRTAVARSMPHIGLLQHASKGFVDGKTIVINKFNAQGDISVGSSIAKEMVNSRYDLLLTMSTLSLQAVANANRNGKTVQVFGLVADPVVAGVGISRSNPLDHPRNLVGIGSFLPVQDAFRIAREMFPDLKRVGVAWNPAEANSRAFVEKARGSYSRPMSKIRIPCSKPKIHWSPEEPRRYGSAAM